MKISLADLVNAPAFEDETAGGCNVGGVQHGYARHVSRTNILLCAGLTVEMPILATFASTAPRTRFLVSAAS